MPLCKHTDILPFNHHAQFWSSSLGLKLQKVWYNPQTYRRAAEGTQESAASTSSSSARVRVSEAATPGRLQMEPWSRSSHCTSVETPHHRTLQPSEVYEAQVETAKETCFGVTDCTETCVVQGVSELETGAVVRGNAVIFWALILDLPLNAILGDRRTSRQNSSRPYSMRLLQHLGSLLLLAHAGTTTPARALLTIGLQLSFLIPLYNL